MAHDVERYRALRTVAAIIRVLAYIVAVVGGLAEATFRPKRMIARQ